MISKDEIDTISRALEERSIFPENTRIRKTTSVGTPVFEVLQASAKNDGPTEEFSLADSKGIVRLVHGDHSEELKHICSCLAEASKYAANETQRRFLAEYIESFETGSLQSYRNSQRTWIKDTQPRVENIFGFVEPYRDPYGTRAEFEGLVAIADPKETKILTKLVEYSATFIRRLPWANELENDGKGPFEKALFEPPDFSSIHGKYGTEQWKYSSHCDKALAYCSSIIFPGINLPNVSTSLQKRNWQY